MKYQSWVSTSDYSCSAVGYLYSVQWCLNFSTTESLRYRSEAYVCCSAKFFCQNKMEINPIKYQLRNEVEPSFHIEEPVSCNKSFTLSVTGASVTWPNVSREFDRLCSVIAFVWNVSLLTGLAIVYHE